MLIQIYITIMIHAYLKIFMLLKEQQFQMRVLQLVIVEYQICLITA